MKMLEKDIQRLLINWLHLNGFYVWVNKTQGTYDPIRKVFRRSNMLKGVSDILGIIPDTGQLLAIEVKTKTGKISEEQKEFIEHINKNGGIAFVCKSLDDLKEKMSPFLKKYLGEFE